MRELVRWIPLQELTTGHSDIDELFNQFFNFPSYESGVGTRQTSWVPSMEGYEKEGQYFVRLDLPGVDPKDVEVLAENDSLIIKGERKKAQEVEEKGYHYRETSYGRFERRLALPKGIETNKIAARYDKGILEISIPLPPRLVAKKVPIQIEGGRSEQSKAA